MEQREAGKRKQRNSTESRNKSSAKKRSAKTKRLGGEPEKKKKNLELYFPCPPVRGKTKFAQFKKGKKTHPVLLET